MNRPFDLILHGASGFTGQQTVAYVNQHAPSSLRWAVSGRDLKKLNAVVRKWAPGREIPCIKADGLDPDDMSRLAESTRVILTTAGPYSKFGRLLVEQCIDKKTHYVDITGETAFIADIIAKHHGQAARDGTLIVPFCGFDSVPSDSLVFFMANHLRKQGLMLGQVVGAFKLKGGFNGGTLATALETSSSDTYTARMKDVLLLNPPDAISEIERAESPDLDEPMFHENLGWITPFVMSPINTRVVRRSNGLFGGINRPYGPSFRYLEGLSVKSRTKASFIGGISRLTEASLGTKMGRQFIKWVGPKPGQGPSVKAMDSGFFKLDMVAQADDGSIHRAVLKAKGDPGNRSTVMALCESAFCLTETVDPVSQCGGGILTPMTAFGENLIQRLMARGWIYEMIGRPS
ncbi:MAG: saccharopine dehydrogenase NADP-binding domain-containing protein [Myxococcota bacterium]|nr:saccharopine dehydrogenase NADP-binding domain-containing protein [Myxococcota bacterium]